MAGNLFLKSIGHFYGWRAMPNHKSSERDLFLAVLDGVADGAEVLAAGLD